MKMTAFPPFAPAGVLCRALLLALTAILALGALAAAQENGGKIDEAVFKNLKFRLIGPANMGGRIDDFAVVENSPSTFYVGAATGGVWKTTNNGTTWEPLFDDAGSISVGDVAIAPSDPNIIWVGTGEPNNRQSSSWGDGVYRSLDGGKTWHNMGLKDTKHIGRIVIDPRDPGIVYVAALGHLWGPNKERGLFKTTDGGKTWTNTLFINEDTGVSDVAIDPQSSMTLYCVAYQRRRAPWGFNGGGAGGGLYKTVDGGANWTKLTNGLPDGPYGRSGINIYRSNPNIVYAIVENAKGGIFRSEDRGLTWKKMSDTNHRPMYYSQIRVDPNNDQRIWVCGAPMLVSEDGGKTFQFNIVNSIHGDFHALWIDPANSNHMLAGSDGGIHMSWDKGRTWDFINTIPLGQFYEISIDNQKPYFVYGGLQDNGSWAGPSGTMNVEGITNDDWFRIGDGDGFYSVVDLSDPSVIYAESQNGFVGRLELKTGERRSIKPEAKAGEKPYRFDWNTPIVISPHNNHTIYLGGNRVFRSTDRGDSWTVSEDITNNQDRDKLPVMGAVTDKNILSRNDGQDTFGQTVTLAESTMKEGLLYAGTDDGNLQISRDGAKTWKNITSNVHGVPKGTYVSRVVPSRYAEGTAYVTFDGHRSDDYGTYVFMTTDYGQSWRSLKGDLPAGVTMRVIREHPHRQNMLFAGTEFGAFVSFDHGDHWTRLKGNFPTVRVDDIQIHPRDNDLVLGTHGRSVWVLDNINVFDQVSSSILSSAAHMFDIRPAVSFRLYNRKGATGNKLFNAPNPPYGAIIDYYVKDKPAEELKITVTNSTGKVIRELKGPKEAGLNRVVWDLRMTSPIEPEEGQQGGGNFFAPGPRVDPGDYTVTLAAAGQKLTKTVRVEEDPRIQISAADRTRLNEALMKVYGLQKSSDAARRSLLSLKTQMTSLAETLKKAPNLAASITTAQKSVSDKIGQLQHKLSGEQDNSGSAGPPDDSTIPLFFRVGSLAGDLDSYTAAPTQDQDRQIADLTAELKSFINDLNKLLDESVANLNKQMRDGGINIITPGKRIEPPI